MNVQRVIHPIGQGAFYTEQLINDNGQTLFTVVYDCGCGIKDTPPDNAQNVIRKWAQKTDRIDILFLSHFHNDHINGIDMLMSKTRAVVMPYVNSSIIAGLNKLKANLAGTGIQVNVSTINPSAHPKVQFLQVVSAKDSNQQLPPAVPQSSQVQTPPDFNMTTGRLVDIPENTTGTNIAFIESGDMFHAYQWIYRPFTRDTDECDTALLTAISALNNHIATLEKEWYRNTETVNRIRKLYKDINKNINNTSMFMFSAPMSLAKCKGTPDNPSPSCLYTGDIKLTRVICSLISKHLNSYTVGAFQVPHHGSSYCWKKFNASSPIPNTTDSTFYFCSHGLHNGNHHPHMAVLADFKLAGKLLWGANDNPSTILVRNFTV